MTYQARSPSASPSPLRAPARAPLRAVGALEVELERAPRVEPAPPPAGPVASHPLPTNWMDRAILAQTYPGRPMTTHHVLDAAAPFERARLMQAVEALVRSVPTLRSFVRRSPLGLERFAAESRWSRLEALVTYSDLPLDVGQSGWLARELDLTREEPFRVLHAPRAGGGYQLVFTLHHSVTDGVGALALFDMLLARYAALGGERSGGELPAPIPHRGARLRTLLARRGPRLALSLLLDNARRAGRFTDRRAALLEEVDAPAGLLRCAVIDVSPQRWQRLKQRAGALGCTRNDLMLAAFLRAAARWRREEGMPEEDFRALMPVDLRGELGVGPSMQNHIGVVEADFTAGEVDGPALPAIVAARIKAERAPARVLATPMALALLGKALPPFAFGKLLRWLDERSSSFMYSFLFSHIRVPEGLRVPASVRMQRVYCLSGLPRQPGIGITITALPDAVTAALAYTPPRLSHEGAARLLALFGDALDEA